MGWEDLIWRISVYTLGFVRLNDSTFSGSIIEGCNFDNASLRGADFRSADLISIYVFDEFDSRTTSHLTGRSARQWLFSHGALVHPENDLNPYLGRAWFNAAREVANTLSARIAGSHQLTSLAKGTSNTERKFARDFADFLLRVGVLKKATPSKQGGWVVKVNREQRSLLSKFSENGEIDSLIKPFFDKNIDAQ